MLDLNNSSFDLIEEFVLSLLNVRIWRQSCLSCVVESWLERPLTTVVHSWRDDHPRSRFPLPHYHPHCHNNPSNCPRNCLLCNIFERPLRHGPHGGYRVLQSLNNSTPPALKTRMSCSQNSLFPR